MDILKVTNWLASRLGWSPWFIVAVIQPLEIFLLAFILREILLRFVFRGERHQQRRQIWRRVSSYFTIAAGILGVWILWRSFSLEWLYQGVRADLQIAHLRIFVRGLLYALVSTASLVFFLFLIRRLNRFFLAKLEEWTARGEPIRYQKAVLLSRQKLGSATRVFLHYFYLALIVGAFYFYIPLMLSFFPETAPYADKLMPYVTTPFEQVAIASWNYLPKLVTLIVILVIVRYLLKVLRTILRAVEREEITIPGFDPEWGHPTYQLARIVAILLTAVVVYPLLPGAGSEIFKGFSVFVGAVITLGSSSAINNIISGIVLTYTRSFRVGDRVKIGDTLGDITEKGLFVTRIRAWSNETVTIPNGRVLADEVVNLSTASKESGLSVLVTAGIGYDVDWRKVHELMKEAARNTAGIEREPEPFVLQTQLGDYAVSYLLIGKTMEPKKERFVASDLRANVLDTFNRAGIEIMTPSVMALRDANKPSIPDQWEPRPFSIPGFGIFNLKRDS